MSVVLWAVVLRSPRAGVSQPLFGPVMYCCITLLSVQAVWLSLCCWSFFVITMAPSKMWSTFTGLFYSKWFACSFLHYNCQEFTCFVNLLSFFDGIFNVWKKDARWTVNILKTACKATERCVMSTAYYKLESQLKISHKAKKPNVFKQGTTRIGNKVETPAKELR